VYDVTVGVDPVQTFRNVKSIPLVVTDHALVVEIIN